MPDGVVLLADAERIVSPLATGRRALLRALADSGIAVALDTDGRYCWWSDECAALTVVLCDGQFEGAGPTIVYANPGACELAGRRLVEFVGRPLLSLVPDGLTEDGMRTIVRELRGGETVCREFRIQHADGRHLTVEVEVLPFGDLRGQVARLALVVRDITEGWEVAASESRLRTAAELGGVGAWELDVRTMDMIWEPRVRALGRHRRCPHLSDVS